MKKLLITGFEPFGGEEINASWEAVSLLPDAIGDCTLIKLRVPVVFGETAEIVMRKAEELNPDIILCIGQAGGRQGITPELVGINLRYAKLPDNRGNQPKDESIIPNGKTAYFSALPVRKMAEKIQKEGIFSQVSYSAGAYVCNDLFYTLLARFENSKTEVGFIHVPYCDAQNKQPSLPISDIVKGLTIAIQDL